MNLLQMTGRLDLIRDDYVPREQIVCRGVRCTVKESVLDSKGADANLLRCEERDQKARTLQEF